MENTTNYSRHLEKLLNKLGAEFEPELVRIVPEDYSRPLFCFQNVEEKIKRLGGRAHYGWAIYEHQYFVEAERHAVWESPTDDLMDITPRNEDLTELLFVSDENYKYTGQYTDNVRVSNTLNIVVDHFFQASESLTKLYQLCDRTGDHISGAEALIQLIGLYEHRKGVYFNYVNTGANARSLCLCKKNKSYVNCCGKNFDQMMKKELAMISKYVGAANVQK